MFNSAKFCLIQTNNCSVRADPQIWVVPFHHLWVTSCERFESVHPKLGDQTVLLPTCKALNISCFGSCLEVRLSFVSVCCNPWKRAHASTPHLHLRNRADKRTLCLTVRLVQNGWRGQGCIPRMTGQEQLSRETVSHRLVKGGVPEEGQGHPTSTIGRWGEHSVRCCFEEPPRCKLQHLTQVDHHTPSNRGHVHPFASPLLLHHRRGRRALRLLMVTHRACIIRLDPCGSCAIRLLPVSYCSCSWGDAMGRQKSLQPGTVLP
mmetsp:Transcript_47551/g.93835  ORF Transcript_47551/g.93835 Transcript_47551/m.93835 type:complete len:262 (+) Transcript_47551:158-943(+)